MVEIPQGSHTALDGHIPHCGCGLCTQYRYALAYKQNFHLEVGKLCDMVKDYKNDALSEGSMPKLGPLTLFERVYTNPPRELANASDAPWKTLIEEVHEAHQANQARKAASEGRKRPLEEMD